MNNGKKSSCVWRGLSAVTLSLLTLSTLGYGIADTWRGTVDSILGTQSFVTDASDVAYKSTYDTGEELMKAAKEIAVREGAEGTVIMKNDNGALPLSKGTKLALFGGAAYRPYMSAAGNTDQVKLEDALTTAGFTVDATLKGIYEQLFTITHVETTTSWRGDQEVTVNTYAPNTTAGDYTTFKIREANVEKFATDGNGGENWKNNVDADTAIVVFSRPGGEGTTYKPGSAADAQGDPTGKNPLALSDDELSVVKAAKEICGKVVVLLNTSCTIEIGPLTEKGGEYEADGIAYIGIPNDYQFTGIVQALDGDVNPTGALADTYATDSTSSPAMVNFGGGYYSDFNIVSDNYDDPRWPGLGINNETVGSFGGKTSYSGGFYIVEAEGIYTGYNYYETRYYDSIVNPSYNAASKKGVTQGTDEWNYAEEVSYTFGYGLSYLPYTQKLTGVTVEDRAGGNITATIEITNNGSKSGLFLAQLYVQTPYSDYDRQYNVEKSAIQFLNSGKVEVAAGATETVTITVPTKYMASYDYTNAKTYILDNGTYYFATGNGAHEAVNNVLAAQGHTGDAAGKADCVTTWVNEGGEAVDNKTFAVSEAGAKITNVADNADLNYYLPGTVTYLSRKDWDGTWPKNYNNMSGNALTDANNDGVSLAASAKKDEWIAELRNQQYTIKTDEPVENVDGITGVTFADIGYEQQTDFDDPLWDRLVAAITMDQAIGAVAHGGSQSDTLDNIDNPIVTQNDGPNGFNRKALSTNNGASADVDPYYVDPDSEAGQFKACVNSQTLLGSSFNPDLAYDWGCILGNTGLWIQNYSIWGGGLNYHRTPYNGRNTEYLSEDPMLTNVLGAELIKGTREFGIICGPKHIGFNDQEYDRAGISVYMNEQKLRETDLRGFQGAVEEGDALGLMVAFNRIGAINASHHQGMLVGIVRNEWGFKGLISTDMMNNAYYFNPESCIMATVTQMADFAGNNSSISLGDGGVDATWAYISPTVAAKDNTLTEAARLCMKYQLYAFANSAVLNISTTPVTPWWESAIRGVMVGTGILSAGFVTLWVVSEVLGKKSAAKKTDGEKEEK